MTLPETPTHTVRVFAMPSSVLRSGHGVSWLAYVGIAEQTRAAEFRNPEDALNYAAMHTLMRAMLAASLNKRATQAADIEVECRCLLCTPESSASHESHGKPRVSGVNFNMARTQGMVCGAVSKNESALVGIDIDRLRGSFLSGFDKVSLTQQELAALAGMPQESAAYARLMLLSAKEAVLKATGHGLSVDPRRVEVVFTQAPSYDDGAASGQANATLSLVGRQPQVFLVRWVTQGEFLIAVASSQEFKLEFYPVTTPLAVRQVLEPAGN